MTGTIDIAPDGKSLVISFPYRADLVDEVRLIPGRRWDRDAKVWTVPTDTADRVVVAFRQHGFTVAPEVQNLVTESPELPDAGALPFPTRVEREAPPALTISLLNERVRLALRRSFVDPVWVVGEVHDLDKGANRAHLFFSLVEKHADSNQPAARVEVAIFATTWERLQPTLEARGLTLRDGVEIRALGRVDLYPPSGRFQLLIDDIDPSFTLGKMALTREAILAELRQKGLDRRNADRDLPRPPLRVGVLTSLDSDGWNDLLRQLEASRLGFAVTCYDVRVQGEALRPGMLAGLRWFAERHEDFDVLCIVRGGGSRTDLAWFDDLDLACAVARHPLKIVCGIGHERDQSVLDVIAHSEKTPTAVGAMLVDCVRDEFDQLEARAATLVDLTRELCADLHGELADRSTSLERIVSARVRTERQGLTDIAHRTTRGLGLVFVRQQELQARRTRDLGARSRLLIERTEVRLVAHGERLRLLDPRRVLERGYALIRHRDRVIPDAAGLEPGMSLDIEFRDGHARATTDTADQ